MNTPDTEWEKEFDEIWEARPAPEQRTHLKEAIKEFISSHTTHWKERVEEVVRGMKLDTSPAEGYTNPIADDYNKACDDILQALDNLK